MKKVDINLNRNQAASGILRDLRTGRTTRKQWNRIPVYIRVYLERIEKMLDASHEDIPNAPKFDFSSSRVGRSKTLLAAH